MVILLILISEIRKVYVFSFLIKATYHNMIVKFLIDWWLTSSYLHEEKNQIPGKSVLLMGGYWLVLWL